MQSIKSILSTSSISTDDRRRAHFRRDADRRNDDFLVRLILTAAALFLIGTYAGVQMEKRNAETLERYRYTPHSALRTPHFQKEAK